MKASSSARSSSVRSSKAKSIGPPRDSGLERGETPPHELGYQRADLFEAVADGETLDVAVVDAFADHRELEAGERGVPGVVAEIQARAVGIAPPERGRRGEAVFGRGRGDRVVQPAPSLPVQAE